MRDKVRKAIERFNFLEDEPQDLADNIIDLIAKELPKERTGYAEGCRCDHEAEPERRCG